ncbi:MAG: hypothetical protein AM324_000960 [Candidatus Thorarchaeota archaeon SMTZ1-83]|nr:MAG: hypothetical protein AM324_01705 [Candidatus Thorarchaeota archaeon SMTZ1-83]
MRKAQEILLVGFLIHISICFMLAMTYQVTPSEAYLSFIMSISGLLWFIGILLFILLLASAFYYRDTST